MSLTLPRGTRLELFPVPSGGTPQRILQAHYGTALTFPSVAAQRLPDWYTIKGGMVVTASRILKPSLLMGYVPSVSSQRTSSINSSTAYIPSFMMNATAFEPLITVIS